MDNYIERNLRSLKIELTNEITAKLFNEQKLWYGQMQEYAVRYLQSGESDQELKIQFKVYEAEYKTLKRAIEQIQDVSRDFEFEIEKENK